MGADEHHELLPDRRGRQGRQGSDPSDARHRGRWARAPRRVAAAVHRSRHGDAQRDNRLRCGGAVVADARPGRPARAAGRRDEVRAVPLPLLAARGDGRSDAGLHLPARRDDGEGRHLPAAPYRTDIRWSPPVARQPRTGRRRHGGARRLGRARPARSQAPHGLLDRESTGSAHRLDRPGHSPRSRHRDPPRARARIVQGGTVHDGRCRRARDRHA